MGRVRPELRRRVRQRAQNLCEYCRTLMDLTGHEFTIDHILPEAQGGSSQFDNLGFCCFWCNNYKQARIQLIDSRTGRLVRLFILALIVGRIIFDGVLPLHESSGARRSGVQQLKDYASIARILSRHAAFGHATTFTHQSRKLCPEIKGVDTIPDLRATDFRPGVAAAKTSQPKFPL